MYQVSVYCIAFRLWRWEIRRDGALISCGTAPTQVAATLRVNGVLKS
jgi:hypothetical protein